jgi:CHAT domain
MPAALLAFANDWIDDKRHLRSLLEESKAISKALAPLASVGLHVLPPIHSATVGEVIDAFREHHYQICVFHFGGHASGSTLLFENESGQPTETHANGLASYLGQQPGLVLVFLNGCSTEPQVRRLRASGIKAVVATTQAIADEVAAEFAKAFYAEFTVRPLRSAFDTAVHTLRARWGDDPRAVTRDLCPSDPHAPSQTPSWPWVLDCDPDYESWSLRSELAPKPGRSRWRRFGLAATALLLLSVASFALTDARRTVCRARGVRSLCATLGVGDLPTADEQVRWNNALAQVSGEGLRAYLQTYPRGAYADEARSRLAACTQVPVESLGPELDIRYPLKVNARPATQWPTKQEAQDDALVHGKKDAARSCEPLRRTAEILRVSVDVNSWKCREDGPGFTCGFEGEIVCRVRDRIAAQQERCRGDARETGGQSE